MILKLYREKWSIFGRGTTPWRDDMVRRALISPHEQVREAAGVLAESGMVKTP